MITNQLESRLNGQLDPALLDPSTKTLNAGKMTGVWVNTSAETESVAEIRIEPVDGAFFISAQGTGDPGRIPWPRTKATPLANLEEEAGQRALAFAVTFDLGFMTAETYIRVNKGVLVIVVYHTFFDDSGRSNYVNREFFYRKDRD
ncbi:MAG TPA: hypothetical protein VI756_28740 [Blastocatellia bacterium]